MKKINLILVVAIVLMSCSSKKEGNMIVEGKIKGLKKGTLYLEKIVDTLLVAVDSVQLYDNNMYRLSDNVESPEVYYLTFKGNTSNKKILFFGEKGQITINDDLETFGVKPAISGSNTQKILDEYMKISTKFNNQNLDFLKENFEAQRDGDTTKVAELNKKMDNLLKRRYLYSTNFALNNTNTSVAPYIALTELVHANVKLLDTINNSLTTEVKNSKYGKKLTKFISDIKANEQ